MTIVSQALRFGAVGLVNTGLGLATIFSCMFFLGLGPALSNLLGYALGWSVGFLANRSWTFADKTNIGHSAPRYLVVVVTAYLINLGVVALATGWGLNPYLAQIFGLAPYTLIVFFACRLHVFKNAAEDAAAGVGKVNAGIHRSSSAGNALLMTACCIGALLFTFAYTGAEQPVHHGDFLIYYTIYKDLARSFSDSLMEGLVELQTGVATDYYNPSSVTPLLPIYFLLGEQRVYYVAGVVILYLAPAAVIATRLVSASFQPTVFVSAFLFHLFWMPTLRGMIDIAGLIPLGLAALLLFRTNCLTRANIRQAIWFGLLLWCAFLLRRWYIFSVMSLAGCGFLFATIRNFREGHSLWRTIRFVAPNYALAGVAGLCGLLTFQAPLAVRIFQSSYKNLYAAFQRDLATHLQIYFDHFGPLTLAFISIGLIAAIRRRNATIPFCACVAVLTALSFDQIHPPDRHHLLPLALFLFPAYIHGLFLAAHRLPSKRMAAGAIVILAGLNFWSTFTPFNWGAAEPLRIVFPQERHAPMRLENYTEYKRLTDDLRQLGAVSIGVFAGETKPLAYDMLFTIEPALKQRILYLANVDARDRFNWSALGVDYAVVATPIPLGQRPGTQRNIEYPAQDILDARGIGAAFARMGQPYHLDEGVTAYVYKRMRPVTPDEIRSLADRFYEAYPDWRNDRIDLGFGLASAQVTLGDAASRVQQITRTTLIMRPGDAAPTRMRLQPNDWFRPRSFAAYLVNENHRRCKGAAPLRIDVTIGDGASTSFEAEGDAARRIETQTSAPFAIAAFPNPKSNCNSIEVVFELDDPLKR